MVLAWGGRRVCTPSPWRWGHRRRTKTPSSSTHKVHHRACACVRVHLKPLCISEIAHLLPHSTRVRVCMDMGQAGGYIIVRVPPYAMMRFNLRRACANNRVACGLAYAPPFRPLTSPHLTASVLLLSAPGSVCRQRDAGGGQLQVPRAWRATPGQRRRGAIPCHRRHRASRAWNRDCDCGCGCGCGCV